MTALEQYERLEATGLYWPSDDAQGVDVILSIGNASLTITDQRDVALAHWSLAAVERLNPGRRPAIYAPGPEAPERIETPDAEMIAAIERVRAAVRRSRPHPGRLRSRLLAGTVLAGLVVAAFWLPGAILRTTAEIVPEAARAALGTALLDEIAVLAGRPCDGETGVEALDRLVAALGPSGPRAAHVLPGARPGAWHLPGGTVILSRSVVEDHESPQVVAGHLLAEAERAARHDPLQALLGHAGLVATLRLATTGTLPGDALSDYAEALMTAPPAPVAPAALAARFRAAGVPLSPYAYALDVTGEGTLPLIEADPIPPDAAVPLLSDGEWVALQGICGQ